MFKKGSIESPCHFTFKFVGSFDALVSHPPTHPRKELGVDISSILSSAVQVPSYAEFVEPIAMAFSEPWCCTD